MGRREQLDEKIREEVLSTVMVAIGMVLGSKPGGKIDPARDRECAVHVLRSLEDEGFGVVKAQQC